MSKSFKPLVYQDYKVGRRIKASKKKHHWKFELDGQEQVVELYESKISGKRKILVNGDIKIDCKKAGPYETFPLKLGTHRLTITEIDDGIFDLSCDNVSFNSLMNRNYRSNQDTKDPFAKAIDTSEPDPEYITKVTIPKTGTDFPIENEKEKEEYIENPFQNPFESPSHEENIQATQKSSEEQSQFAIEQKGNAFKHTEQIDLFSNFNPNDLFSVPVTNVSDSQRDLFVFKSKPAFDNASIEESIFKGNPFEQPTENPVLKNFGVTNDINSKFEENVVFQQPPQLKDPFNLFDLDSLHLGDNYSPAAVKKFEEANKPNVYSASLPDVPMNQLATHTGNLAPANNAFNSPAQYNTMAAMMAYNQYMSGMITNQWTQGQPHYR